VKAMDDPKSGRKRKPALWIPILMAVAAVMVTIAAVVWRRLQVLRRPSKRLPPPGPVPLPVHGLTEGEAQARWQEGQDNVILLKPPRTREEMFRENAYTVFNLSLVGLAAVQFLLGQYLSAVLSLFTIALNIGLNMFQELFAQRRLRQVQEETRPRATVIREKRVRSIDPSEIVVGDALVAGPGDQLLVDGEVVGEAEMVVEESILAGQTTRVTKAPGDPVYAGSFCISGRSVYEAQKVGDERLIASRAGKAQAHKGALTPLERTMDRVLRALLVVVALYMVLLLAVYFFGDMGLPLDVVNDAISVIFSIAPASLYFMIVLTYASGMADLAKVGALVHRPRSVESLAQATVICFARAGILTGTHVEVEEIAPPEGQESLAESRLRQILGDFARTTSLESPATRAMTTSFEGSRRTAREEAPFWSLYGWSAVAFDDEDLSGVYVLGTPEILEPYLATGSEQPEEMEKGEKKGGRLPDVRKVATPLGRLFRRGSRDREQKEKEEGAAATNAQKKRTKVLPSLEHEGAQELRVGAHSEKGESPGEEEESKPGLFRRFGQRVRRVLRREEAAVEEEEIPKDEDTGEIVLLFAYHPELAPLHTAEGLANLPEGLIPLCELHYTERVRPDAVEAIRMFAETGVDIKVLSTRAEEQTAAILRQAGLGSDRDMPLDIISGDELAAMNGEELAQAVQKNTVFGHLRLEQFGLVVTTLREDGELVAVVGDGVNDLAAMGRANLAIARRSSSQAALSVADILLLEDSPSALSRVLDKGQRIVHGLLDVLKLNLVFVVNLALLILGLRLMSASFPFQSIQGTVIQIVTVALPSAGLSLWAASGVLGSARFGRLLARFVAPPSITMGAAGSLVYGYFLRETGQIPYAQLTLTYTLVFAGLVLVIFVRPPIRPPGGDGSQPADLRPTVMVLVLLVLFLVVAGIPLSQELLKLSWLEEPHHYLVVALTVVAWAVLLRFIWLVMPVEGRVGRLVFWDWIRGRSKRRSETQ
jgi:magnesium-transporting ATPase (P-type)